MTINLIWEIANHKTENSENKKYDRVIYYNLEHRFADDYNTQWETVDDLNAIASRGEYLHPTEAYKELTYTDEAYEKYVNYLIEQQNGI